mmetsp:Transcript_83748/g.211207  ORF Transcript_83748/g.211207 Transcript_83748/m.211207 type:complete len:211 (-) Transcript_83748:267-899(-)
MSFIGTRLDLAQSKVLPGVGTAARDAGGATAAEDSSLAAKLAFCGSPTAAFVMSPSGGRNAACFDPPSLPFRPVLASDTSAFSPVSAPGVVGGRQGKGGKTARPSSTKGAATGAAAASSAFSFADVPFSAPGAAGIAAGGASGGAMAAVTDVSGGGWHDGGGGKMARLRPSEGTIGGAAAGATAAVADTGGGGWHDGGGGKAARLRLSPS